MRQWLGAPWGALVKIWSFDSELTDRAVRRGIIGLESHEGRGASRSVLSDVRTEGWAWRRRCISCFHVGRGTMVISCALSRRS